MRNVIMQRSNNSHLTKQAITAVLLFGFAFAASGAEQKMRAPSASTAAQPIAVVAPTGIPPVAKPPAAPMLQKTPTPTAPAQLPDLAFSNMTVDKTTYFDFDINSGVKSLVVNNIVPSIPSGTSRPPRDPCDRSFTFPLQLVVKNIGQAEFVPKDSSQAVGVTIGTWNAGKDIIKLAKTAAQTMDFSVTLRPGKYMLNANIDLKKQVAEARTDNNKLSWPLEVTCEMNRNEVRKLNK